MAWLDKIHHPEKYLAWFCKWAVLGALMGSIGGVLGAVFHHALHFVTHLRLEHTWLVLLLPIGGLLSVGWYRLLKLKKEDFSLISRFYPPASPDQIREAVAATRQITGLITCGNPVHRLAATAVLHGLGNERIGLMVPPKSNPALAESNEKLRSLFNQALLLYPALLEQLRDHLSFREPFGADFDRIFG